MSSGSSEAPAPAKHSLTGWPAAIWSTLSVGVIYFVLPVPAMLLALLYPLSRGWTQAHAESWLNNSVTGQFLFVLLAETFTVLAVFGLLKLFGWSWRSIGMTKPRWYQPLIGLLAFVPYMILYLIIIAVAQALVPSLNVEQKQQIGFESVHGTVALLLAFISLVILPPLAEEITMRGFLYTGLKKWLPRLVAVLVVSLLFGAAHLAEGGAAGPLWVGFIDTFILSLVLLFLREKTGNLWAGITLHALKNGVAFYFLYLAVR